MSKKEPSRIDTQVIVTKAHNKCEEASLPPNRNFGALYYLAYSPQLSLLRRGQFIAAIAIFGGVALMPRPQDIGIEGPEGVLHFIGNVLLMISAWVACLGKFSLVVPLLISIPYSIAIELSQSFTEHRDPSLSDLLANMIGIFVGYCICLVVSIFLKRYHSQESQAPNSD